MDILVPEVPLTATSMTSLILDTQMERVNLGYELTWANTTKYTRSKFSTEKTAVVNQL